MARCSQCNADNPEERARCQECGAPLEAEEAGPVGEMPVGPLSVGPETSPSAPPAGEAPPPPAPAPPVGPSFTYEVPTTPEPAEPPRPAAPPPPPSAPLAPPPPQAGYAVPQPGYAPRQETSTGLLSLILGIVGIVFLCCGPILGPIAIVLGSRGRKDPATNQGLATAGFILGIIATALSVLVILFYVVIFIVAASTGNLN